MKHHGPSLFVGDAESPNMVFAVFEGRRYGVATAEALTAAGLGWPEILPFDSEIQNLQIGPEINRAKDAAAIAYLQGSGIEIGALNNPSILPHHVQIRYVDFISNIQIKHRYSNQIGFVNVDIVDDGEYLCMIPDESVDFIVANHFLEHTENPIGTIRNHLLKVRSGGKIIYTLPDKRFTFDAKRPVTPFDHLLMDDLHGPEWSRRGHFLEFARHVSGLTAKEDIEHEACMLMEEDHRPHFHVWDEEAATDFFVRTAGYLEMSYGLISIGHQIDEIVAVLEKR